MARFRTSGVNWEGRPWRTVPSLTRLAADIEQLDPARYPVDGTVASRRHDQNNPRSDHRPDGEGDVRAIDFGGSTDSLTLWCENLRLSQDRRIRYVIYNGRIFSNYQRNNIPPYTWRPYTGANPHRTHVHLSTDETGDNNTAPWPLEGEPMTDPRFTDETAARLNQIAAADADDKTGIGGVFHDDWQWALTNGVMTVHSNPIDLVSKQEFAAHLHRYNRLEDNPTSPSGINYGDTVILQREAST